MVTPKRRELPCQEASIRHSLVDRMDDDVLPAVNAAAELYYVPRDRAHAFAVHFEVAHPQNFSRMLDPRDTGHHFVEDWQGLYNVRWLEKLGQSGDVMGWILIWGQPRHSLKKFYEACASRWPELPAWNTFRQAAAPGTPRKMSGFRVTRLSVSDSLARLDHKELPVHLKVRTHGMSQMRLVRRRPSRCCA